jgi:predicted glycosyltransferase involved in capsule biosynthesis
MRRIIDKIICLKKKKKKKKIIAKLRRRSPRNNFLDFCSPKQFSKV